MIKAEDIDFVKVRAEIMSSGYYSPTTWPVAEVWSWVHNALEYCFKQEYSCERTIYLSNHARNSIEQQLKNNSTSVLDYSNNLLYYRGMKINLVTCNLPTQIFIFNEDKPLALIEQGN